MKIPPKCSNVSVYVGNQDKCDARLSCFTLKGLQMSSFWAYHLGLVGVAMSGVVDLVVNGPF